MSENMSEPGVSIDLYPAAIAMAAFTIIYTLGSALAAGFQHLLFKWNGKQAVYVSLMSVSIFVQQLFTLSHQLFSAIRWQRLQVEVYYDNLHQWRNPDASIVYKTSPSLVLRTIFAIRTYFFNVESLLFFFWSLMLFVSIWEIQSRVLKSQKFIFGSKILCFVLPAIQVVLTSTPALMNIVTLHLILTNFIMVTTLSCGCVFLLLILYKCMQVMWNASWTHKIKFWGGYDNGKRAQRRANTSSIGSSSCNSENEDRYILVRFIAGFVIISGLQASFLLSQYVYAKAVWRRKQPDAPHPVLGWTSDEQVSDWAFFLAGSSTGYLILIVFGTTRESRVQVRRLWKNFRQRIFGPNDMTSEGYLNFRDRECTSPFSARDSFPERRPKPPPKPMRFAPSPISAAGSPSSSIQKYSPGFENISLCTPRRF